MAEILKLVSGAAVTFWQYPIWARTIFVLTILMIFTSLILSFLLHPKSNHLSLQNPASKAFLISEPADGNYIIAKRFSIHGKGAQLDGQNSLNVKLIDLKTGLEKLNEGRLNVNSDGSWRFDYAEFPHPGSFRLVADAIFGTELLSKQIVLHHRPSEVLDAARTILKNVPEDPNYSLDPGASSQNVNQQAVGTLVATTDLTSLDNVAETMYRMGNYFLIERKFDDAINTYKRLLDIYPTHAKALSNLSRAYHEKGDIEESIRTLYSFPRAKWERSASLHNLATAQYGLGRKEEALRTLKGIIENDPLYPSAYDFAARISVELGHQADAERYYKAAIKISTEEVGPGHQRTRSLVDALQQLRGMQAR